MPTYEVTVRVQYNEIYSVEATSEEEARRIYLDEGALVMAEAQSVEDILSVEEEEDY